MDAAATSIILQWKLYFYLNSAFMGLLLLAYTC